MPRSLDPSSRITMVLACDQDKPAETRPEIYAKSPTLGTQRMILSLVNKVKHGVTVEMYEEMSVMILDAAEKCFIGWKNIPIQFSRDGIQEVLNIEEIIECLTFIASAPSPSPEDKKKYASQPSSDAVNSVSHASVDAVTS